MNLYDIVSPMSMEEAKATKTRLDPKCWKGKHIGTPKTKVKGGVRVNNCVPNESVEETVAGGSEHTPSEREIKKIIWDTLHIDRPTAKETLEAAITLLAERPKTRTVQQLMGHLSMLADRSKIKLNPTLANIMSNYNESVEEDSWSSATTPWGGEDPWTSDQHEMVEGVGPESIPADSDSPIHGGMEEEYEPSPVASAIVRRIMFQHPDLLKDYGPNLVNAAISNVADYVGDVDEIGSSDVSGWVNQVERMLKENPPEAFNEGAGVAYVVSYFDTKTGDKGESTVSALTKDDAVDKIVQLMHDRGYDVTVTGARPLLSGVDEGYQDFNKVEPYAVCLAGKPVKEFDYYEDARRFHDNWKRKLDREGNKEKADKITLMPITKESATAPIIVPKRKAKEKQPAKFHIPYSADDYVPPAVELARDEEAKKKEVKEMDKSQKGAAGWNIDDYPLGAKGTTVKPTTRKKVVKDLTKVLDKAFDPDFEKAKKGVVASRLHQQAKNKEVKEDHGSWIVYDPETKQIKKRFKTHTAGKSYAKAHGLGFASSEYYFDNVKEKAVAEVATDYSKRRQRERDVDAGKPVAKPRQPRMTDYQKRRAEQRRQEELGEDMYDSPVTSAITHRILTQRLDLLKQYGPEAVGQAVDEVAEYVGDVDEIGSSDVSAWVMQVERTLKEQLPEAANPAQQAAIAIAMKKAHKKPKHVDESTNYWTKLQTERSTKLNSLVNELKESVK